MNARNLWMWISAGLYCASASIGWSAPITPPLASTEFTRNIVASTPEMIRMYADTFQNYIAWEDFNWGTNAVLGPNVTWNSRQAYTWTLPTGRNAWITGEGVTNIAVTNGFLSCEMTNTVKPNIYLTMGVSNTWKYFIVGMQFQYERLGSYSDPTNFHSTGIHFGVDPYYGSFSSTFHNTVLNGYDRYSNVAAYTNGAPGYYNVIGTISWDSVGLGLPWCTEIETNRTFFTEIGYVADASSSYQSDKYIYANFNGFITNALCPAWAFTNAFKAGSTNFTIQLNHGSWLMQHRVWLDKMWVRVPGRDGWNAPSR